jgi:hypothetical protein
MAATRPCNLSADLVLLKHGRLQTTMKTYTVAERSQTIYQTVVGVFDYNSSNDVVTPAALVESQIDSLPNLGGKILVPGAGVGSYVNALIQRGVKPENIYAVEISPSYHRLGLRMFGRLGVNYVLADYLTWDPKMQFDVIIGNPPYQGGNLGKAVYKSLWPLFWAKSFELSKDDGFISLITPLSWCSPAGNLKAANAVNGEKRLWNVFQKYNSLADVTSIKAFFPGVGSSFSLVTVDKSGNTGLKFTDGFDTSYGFYPLSGPDEVRKQLTKDGNVAQNFSSNSNPCDWRVSMVSSRGARENTVELLAPGEIPTTNAHPTLIHYYNCGSKERAKYLRSRILECSLVINKHCRYFGWIDYNVVGMISVPDLPCLP